MLSPAWGRIWRLVRNTWAFAVASSQMPHVNLVMPGVCDSLGWVFTRANKSSWQSPLLLILLEKTSTPRPPGTPLCPHSPWNTPVEDFYSHLYRRAISDLNPKDSCLRGWFRLCFFGGFESEEQQDYKGMKVHWSLFQPVSGSQDTSAEWNNTHTNQIKEQLTCI